MLKELLSVMKQIEKIVIKGTSGYCPADCAYNDKVTLTSDSISYEYKPYEKSASNPIRKWSYKTNSLIFRNEFCKIAGFIPMALNLGPEEMCMDIGSTEFNITFSDKTKYKHEYFVSSDCFEDLFRMIKKLVPSTECVPEVLRTEEDY